MAWGAFGPPCRGSSVKGCLRFECRMAAFLLATVNRLRRRQQGASRPMRQADKKRRQPPEKHYNLGRGFKLGKLEKPSFPKKVVAPRVGFEPTAIRLTVECSTAELSGSSLAFAGQAAPICSGVRFGNPVRDFVLPKRKNYRDQAMNCSVTIRSSRLCPGSNSRVSVVSGSIRRCTWAISRSSF